VCYQFADDTQLLVGIDSTNVRTLHSAAVNFEAHLKVAIGQFPVLALLGVGATFQCCSVT